MPDGMIPVVSKVVEGKYNLYLVVRIGSSLEMGDKYSVIVKSITDLSDISKQIRIPQGDWELLRKEIDAEFRTEEETNA